MRKLSLLPFLRKLLLFTVMVLMVGCAARKPTTFDFTNQKTYDASFDKTWESVISIFAEANIPIVTLEKDSGLIVSDNLAASGGNYYCKTGFFDHIRSPEGRFNVFVRKVSDGKTSVQINSTYRAQLWFGDNLKGWAKCVSTGELERLLFKNILARIGTS